MMKYVICNINILNEPQVKYNSNNSIELLKEMIKDKDDIIKLQKEMIFNLKQLINK